MDRRGDASVAPATLLRQAFDAYNRQDIDALFAVVSDDVTSAADREPVRGKDALRAYWHRQWQCTCTRDEVIRVDLVSAGRYAVDLAQEVRSIEGDVLSTGRFRYEFVLRDGMIVELVSKSRVA